MLRRTDASNPADWVEIAEADFAMVRLTAEREISFSSCRSKLAESLEKLLKAELIRIGWPLEETHDLQRLGKFLRERGSDLTDSVHPLVNALTEAYFVNRYPGFDLDDPDWPALRQQIEQTSRLLATIKQRVQLQAKQ